MTLAGNGLLDGLEFAEDATVKAVDGSSSFEWLAGRIDLAMAYLRDQSTLELVILLFAALVVLLLLRYLFRLFRKKAPQASSAALLRDMEVSIRRQKVVISFLIALFFGGFLGWASVFELASAALAPGVVSPEGSKRPVQHLEGGIISEVLVRDGDRVRTGQPLIVLEDVSAKADVDTLNNQRAMLQIRMRRLLAERDGAEEFKVRLSGGSSEVIREAVAYETEQFESRRKSFLSQREILDTRISQLQEEILGLKDQISSIDEQLRLLDLEISDVKTLLAKGLHRRPRLLALERGRAELEGNRAAAVARIARSRQAIAETKAQIESVRFQLLEGIDQEIGEVRQEQVRVTNELKSRRDILTRTTINAPDDGKVVGLKVTSSQAVIKPGDIVLEIVPENAELLIDAQVSPLDIDDIHEGQSAQVHLSAYKKRHMPRIEGIVDLVSADRFQDERTGAYYFLARISIDPGELENLAPGVAIVPGMPAEVMIRTGDQTLLDYLITPFLQSLRRSFRES